MTGAMDPSIVTVGLHMGSVSDGLGGLVDTMGQVTSRLLQIQRLVLMAGPLIIQSMWIHDVEMRVWLARVGIIYGILGAMMFAVMPEQMYFGLGLSPLRGIFQLFHSEERFMDCNESLGEKQVALPPLRGLRLDTLDRARVKLRCHCSDRYVCLSPQGWAVTGGESRAVTLQLQQATLRDEAVPDTYTFRIADPNTEFDGQFLSFRAVNQIRAGGWLGAWVGAEAACPYKLVQDSATLEDAVKLLCAWGTEAPPTQRYCTGFYLAEKLSFGQPHVGHSADRDAAIFEVLLQQGEFEGVSYRVLS